MATDLDQLAAAIDRKLDQRLGRMERYLDGVGNDVDSIAKQVGILMQREGISVKEEDPEAQVQVDKIWQCVKCGARLGFYDEAEDLLRVRHKDITIWMKVGVGGHASLLCRSCGELNTVNAAEPAPEA